jgi:hypothetical protein
MVLPDGPPALSHPTNEDLFAGAPVQRPLRGLYTLFWRTGMLSPFVGRDRNHPYADLATDLCGGVRLFH